MNHLLSFIICMLLVFATRGQSNYTEAMQQGDAAFNNGQYKTAINKYFAAEAFDPTKKNLVKEKVNRTFEKIEKLRLEAINSKNKIEEQKVIVEKALMAANKSKFEADSAKNIALKSDSATKVALAKSQKLIDAFYFYADRFALAYKNTRFYFIDKNGSEVRKLGWWEKAEQFNTNGFARVKLTKENDLLLDTSGKEYRVAYDVMGADSSDRAIDFSGKYLDRVPVAVFENKQLEVLILSSNNVSSLPPEIGELKNLKSLDLSSNLLTSLPPELADLKNLTSLYVSRNQLRSFPKSIGQLRNLTTLNLTQIKLDSLPKEIGELKDLVSLDLSLNNLRSLPPEIGELKNLASLSLYYNQITGLSKEIGQLKNLRYLLLTGNNNITQSEIEKIKALLPDCKIIKEAK